MALIRRSLIVRRAAAAGRTPAARGWRPRTGSWLVALCLPLPLHAAERRPAANPSADTIRLALVRFDGGSGPVLVSSGVPLPPGLVRPSGTPVRLEIDGQARPAGLRVLDGRHRDGSARALLVQFRYDVPPPARLQPSVFLIVGSAEGGSRGGADPVPPTYTMAAPLPAAAALPTDPRYLVRTRLVGATVPVGDPFAGEYDANFARWGDAQWRDFDASWRRGLSADDAVTHNYYDRALAYYAWWMRTGRPEHWERATRYLIAYRERYLRPNDYRVQPHNIQIEGLEAHYLLTGDEESRTAVFALAGYLRDVWLPVLGDRNNEHLEARIQARAMQGLLAAAALEATGGGYADAARAALESILRTQGEDGSYTYANLCFTQYNYMVGLLNDALIRYHDGFEPDDRIVEAVRRSVSYLWSTQWVAGAAAFRYASGVCPGKADTAPAPDLNLQIVNGFGWIRAVTGSREAGMRGDRVFTSGVRGAWLQGRKQFNESYASSFRYLAYRRSVR